MKSLITPIALLAISKISTVSTEWEAKLYQTWNHIGPSIHIHGQNVNSCVNTLNYKLCDDSSCDTVNNRTRSITTLGGCVRIYAEENCEGTPLMELRPGTHCHYTWDNCEIRRKMKSIGGCYSYHHDNFDQNTGFLIPNGNLERGNLSSPNYLEDDYPANLDMNWIITLPYGQKAQLLINDFELEDGTNCQFDKATISELVTGEVIFERCGDMDNLPLKIVSKSNQIRINFKTDGSVGYRGFFISWENCTACEPTGSIVKAQDVNVAIDHIDMDNFTVYDSKIAAMTTPNINFVTFKKENPDIALDGNSVDFEAAKHMIYIHGYATSDLADGVEVKEAIFEGTDDVSTVTLLDWRRWSLPNPDSYVGWPPNYKIVALDNLPKVSVELKDFLRRKFKLNSNIYFVGFSLGAHIAGTACRKFNAETGFVMDRITALDPAGPIFEYSLYGLYPVVRTNTLRPTDAQFVDVIHGSTVLGMNEKAGHLDIYNHEAGCANSASCTHHKTIHVFTASLISCSLITCPTSLSKLRGVITREYFCDTSDFTKISSAGYLADKYEGRGRHELYTFVRKLSSGYDPVSTGNCSSFLNLQFPANKRVCKNPSVDLRCKDKPYLYKCKLGCVNTNQFATCSSEGLSLEGIIQLGAVQEDEGAHWIGGSGCALAESCKNENGENIPYFILYKRPNSDRFTVINGDAPFESRIGANDPNSYLGITLNPIYRNNPGNYLIWSDSPPRNPEAEEDEEDDDDVEPFVASHGHSKGVLVFNGITGFLLVHSVPKFPSRRGNGYSYPDSGEENGQTAICISLRGRDERDFANQLLTLLTGMHSFKPNVYENFIDMRINANVRAAILRLLNGPHPPRLGAPLRQAIPLPTQPGNAFTVRVSGRTTPDGRRPEMDAFLHLASEYRTNLLAQSWGRQRNRWGSSCKAQFTVENINEVGVNGRIWTPGHDHSKWAVSDNRARPIVCIGDLNRAPSQVERGGMFVCTENLYLYDLFNGFVRAVQLCPRRVFKELDSELGIKEDSLEMSLEVDNSTKNPLCTIFGSLHCNMG